MWSNGVSILLLNILGILHIPIKLIDTRRASGSAIGFVGIEAEAPLAIIGNFSGYTLIKRENKSHPLHMNIYPFSKS
jgi:hypothetical protein